MVLLAPFPPDVIAAADAKYVKKSGDAMTVTASRWELPTPLTLQATRMRLLSTMALTRWALMPAGMELKGKAGFDASTGRLNVFTGHQDNVIALRVE